MKKRILALVLTLAMLLSVVPGQVFATETPTEHTEHNFVEVQPEKEAPVADSESPAEPTEPEEPEKAPVKSTQTIDSAQAFLEAIDYDAAVADLTKLTEEIGVRVAGSEKEYLGQAYVEGIFTALGYQVTRQDVSTKNGAA